MVNSVWSREVRNILNRATEAAGVAATAARSRSQPFPSPADWRDVWIYFLMLDRFNNPAAPPRLMPYDVECETFQGGTFDGVRAQLPYLKKLGVGAIWLSPFLKNCLWNEGTMHGYGIQDFLAIDPRFTSNPEAAARSPALAARELRALVDAAHKIGIYVIADIVLNHTGDLFAYPDGRSAMSWNYSGEYPANWRNKDGTPVDAWTDIASIARLPANAGVWPRELQRNDYFRRRGEGAAGVPETMGDFASLKELVTEYLASDGRFPVRDILIRAYQYHIAAFDLDGYRIDTLKYVEPDFARIFGNAMREFALSIGKRNFYAVAEVWDTDEKIARFIGRNTAEGGDLVGVDAALDFPVHEALTAVMKGASAPTRLVDLFENRKQVQKHLVSSHGEASRYFIHFLDNHDMDRRFHYRDPGDPRRYDSQMTMALTCLFAFQGIPCLYYGTEQGLHGAGQRREAVREALWGMPGAFDTRHPFYRTVQSLGDLRRREPALRYGRQYFRPVSGNGEEFGHSPYPQGVLAYSRILNDREVLIVANTNVNEPVEVHVMLDANLHPDRAPMNLLFSNRDGAKPPARVRHAPGRPASVKVRLQPMEAQIVA